MNINVEMCMFQFLNRLLMRHKTFAWTTEEFVRVQYVHATLPQLNEIIQINAPILHCILFSCYPQLHSTFLPLS